MIKLYPQDVTQTFVLLSSKDKKDMVQLNKLNQQLCFLLVLSLSPLVATINIVYYMNTEKDKS